MKVTDNGTHDSECAIEFIETARKKAEAVGCKHELFRYLGKRGMGMVGGGELLFCIQAMVWGACE